MVVPRASLRRALSSTVEPARGRVTVAARALTKRFGTRTALDRRQLRAVAPASWSRSSGPTAPARPRCCRSSPASLEPLRGRGHRAPRAAVGWVPQQPALYSKLSVAENLRLFARLEKLADPASAVEPMLEQTGLEDRADEEVGRLSGGNQQRVNIAIGLLCEPPVLLLDEPSASLDPRQRERLWEFIGGLAGRGTTVVFSTHNVAEAERYAGRVLVLVDGELLFTGTPAELRAGRCAAGATAARLRDGLRALPRTSAVTESRACAGC